MSDKPRTYLILRLALWFLIRSMYIFVLYYSVYFDKKNKKNIEIKEERFLGFHSLSRAFYWAKYVNLYYIMHIIVECIVCLFFVIMKSRRMYLSFLLTKKKTKYTFQNVPF